MHYNRHMLLKMPYVHLFLLSYKYNLIFGLFIAISTLEQSLNKRFICLPRVAFSKVPWPNWGDADTPFPFQLPHPAGSSMVES